MAKLSQNQRAILKAVGSASDGLRATDLVPAIHHAVSSVIDRRLISLRNGKLTITDAGRAALAEGGRHE